MNRAGGPVVFEWPGYFLRDDTVIRFNASIEPHEAYSLFREHPYGRVCVLAGHRKWAIEQAGVAIVDDRGTQ